MWPAFSAALSQVHTVFSNLARVLSGRIGGASGPVQPMFRTRRGGGATLSERDRLASECRKARRQHRPVKARYSEARALTHAILARGQQWTR